jgi:hypothetical protein
MVTFLITSLFILALLALAVYFWQKPASSIKTETLPPSPGRGLFIDGTPDGVAQAAAEAESEAIAGALRQRNDLLGRAKEGDKSTLQEAQATRDAFLYDEVLNSLVAVADSEPALLSLVSYVSRHELTVNGKLAEKFIDSCKNVPDPSATAKMLHVAALSAHEAYVVPEGYRGIQETVVGPGRYYVNTLAISPIIIPTTNLTVEWTSGEVANTFNPFEVISKDGFTMQLEVRVVFRVKPEDAPFMVAKIGGIDRLIQNVMHQLIDSIFRNQASESSAMAYLQNRNEEHERAEARVRAHLLKYHVDVVNVLI